MTKIDEMLNFNKKFVESKEYEKYSTSKYPDKKIAIVTCMDTRLVTLLPAALGIKNGDVKMIKNAGVPIGAQIPCAAIAVLAVSWAFTALVLSLAGKKGRYLMG